MSPKPLSFYDVDIPDQHPGKKRRKLPRHVIQSLMIKEAKTSISSGVVRCTRCGNNYLLKHIVYIQGGWNQEDQPVCRLCYNRRNDIKVR